MATVADNQRSPNGVALSDARNLSDKVLSEIWADVLRRPDVEKNDNFFEIGGDSLKAMEVITRVREILHIDLPLIAFFEDPTLAHLATVVDELKEATSPLIPRDPSRSEFPLSYSQQMFWLLEQQNPGTGLYNTARIFRIHGKVDSAVLESSLNELRRRHEILRVRFIHRDNELIQVVDAPSPLPLPLIDLSGVEADARENAALNLAYETVKEPFNLSTGPLLRARLITLDFEEHLLCMAIHHTVSDGFTGGIVLNELGAIYDAFAMGEPNPLPEQGLDFTDYAAWEQEWMTGSLLEKELGYWSSALKDVPTSLDLPTDLAHSPETRHRGRKASITVSAESLSDLQGLAHSNGATLFTVLAAGLRILLYRWSGQSDFLVGTIASNRSRSGTERMVGCFVNPLPLRNRVSDRQSALELLNSETNAVMDAFAHQDCPFTRIVESVNPERSSNDNPLFNVALLLQNFPDIAWSGRWFQAEHASFDPQFALIDLRFIITETPHGLQCDCEYSPDLFHDSTIQSLLNDYLSVMMQVAAAPEKLVEHIGISEVLRRQGEEFRRRRHKRTIAVAANFTSEPIEEPIAFWMEQLHIPSRIKFAPFDNVFQQLLDPASMLARNSNGFNVVLIRWPHGEASANYARELAAALKTAAGHGAAPIILCVCPPSVAHQEQVLAGELNGQPGVHLVTSVEILDLYPVENYRDEYADAVGAVPYTSAFFVALASMVARRIYGIRTAPYKVIALDCDNTLWSGVCGEDGPLGVEVDAPRRALQDFMLAQRNAGMLLCLCSKNAQEDVDAAFESNPGMVLRKSHIAASRVNWQPKSHNLKELSQELGLGLDSIVLVDDNPLDCAEVRANCPGTLVLELPANPARFRDLLRHFWAFDHWNITREDRQRSELYEQERQREQLRGESTELEEFLRDLKLKTDIRPLGSDDLARVSQLTQRTNQFNCTTIRRTESDIERACSGGLECLVADVSDRFGNYGLVGVVMLAQQHDALFVDTLLMSCRALGRKVEHRILATLGDLALKRGLARVDVMFAPTPKNRPAQDFLESLGAEFRLSVEGNRIYRFPAAYASRAESLKISESDLVAAGLSQAPPLGLTPSAEPTADPAQIATELGSVEAIAAAIRLRLARMAATGSEKARNTTEKTLAAIWSELLRVSEPGIDDNFFRIGGNSLLGVQLISRIRQTLGVELSLQAIFATPTIVGLSKTIESERRSRTGLLTSLVKRSRNGTAPASFAQKRLWFISQLEPSNSLYNVPEMRRIHGVLNVAALERGIREILRRHESLRTTFGDVDGQPVQVLASESSGRLTITDLSQIEDESERERECARLAYEEASRPFDLSRGPLIRGLLLRLAPEEHALVLTLHHIVCDRWSLGVLFEELSALYAAFTEDLASPLPELSVQYADFSEWQHDWLRGENLDNQTSYWERQLAGAPALIELPSDRPRPSAPNHRGAIEAHLLPAALVDNLAAISQTEGATLFMALLAAFGTLLFRYSGQEDIVIGSPVAGRNYTETEPLIGFFVNTLALRIDLSGNPTFEELVRRIKDLTLNAYAHQDIPFEKLVEELRTERSLSYNPLFQVIFAFQNAPVQPLTLPGLTVERIALHPGTALFDLSWFVVPIGKDLLLRVEYSTDLFNGSTIARSLEHFHYLLSGAAANPRLRISELPLLTAAEQDRLLTEWNDTAERYSSETCTHYLFEQQAIETPDNVALSSEGRRITYRELNERGNQIARFLRDCGVRPGVCVGIALPRSSDMITGLLGILKAGGAYLPLDIDYPRERLAYIIGDAQIPIILTEKHWLDLLPSDVSTICLDRDAAEIDRQPAEDLPQLARSSDLAYVIYTSGSTGRPKGVEIDHRGLLNLVTWHQREYCLQADDRATQVASPAFDASVWEIWPYLTAGASLHIPDEATRSSPAKLVEWLERQAITLTFLPTPLAEAVLDHLKTDGVQGLKLRALLTGGDKLHRGVDPDLPFALVNHYGPTENTVVTTWARVACGPQSAPPIGKPIANTRVYVLDRRMEPVPIGVPGELYIGGDGLARGYRNRPELTAERFVCDPFHAGTRLFRSGDRVRYLPSGDLEFMGRLDDQVKLRGYRIEPREIEAVLSTHGAVKECVAIARDDMPGGRQLVAYVVSREQGALPETDFRRLLRSQLPEYMVPSVFVSLDAFPLMPNGKVDRKALPAPKNPSEKQTYVGPKTPMEEILAATWIDVMGLKRVGIHDNFFELGGHSLLATRVVSRLGVFVGIDVPVRWLFESPTIAELASRIDGMGQANSLPPLRHRESSPDSNKEAPLSFAQERLWFLDQLEPNHPWFNSPFAIRMKGDVRVDALEGALNEIVRRHEGLRTTFRAKNYHPVQVIAPELRVEIPTVDVSQIPFEEQEAVARRMAIESSQRTFNLETGPVFRANLLRLADQDHILLLNFHHIVIDGWSLWPFMRELGTLYEAFIEGRQSPLPELPIQYADYAVWQREWLRGDVLAKSLSYWKKQLDGAPRTLELPTDHVRPQILSYYGATEKMVCPSGLSDQLNALSRREGATLFMTLLAAFQVLLSRYTGQEDVVVGSAIANRTRMETENLIGFFVNPLVMRTDVSGNPSFRELLRRVRITALEAYANQDLPFEKLVEALQPERDLSQTPLFQVCFVLQNAPRGTLTLPALELSAIEVHNGTTKYDLLLLVSEKPEGLTCTVEYSTDLFEAASVQRLLGHYRVLLESIVENPDERVAAFPLLTAAEEQVILTEWNNASNQFQHETCVPELFELQVSRTPDNAAVVFESTELTYSELNSRANQLAHRLQDLGVGPETLVGICVERSLEMLIGILGILKAGGGYLPLDPSYPQSRLTFMLEDAQIPVLLTQAKLAPKLLPHDATVICLDSDWGSIASEPTENPLRLTEPENVAYVIYTSGSTGKPKGCQVEHRNLVHYLEWANQYYFQDSREGNFPLFSSLSFDLTVTSVFLPLLRGRTIQVFSQDMEIAQILKEIFEAASGIDCVKLTPSHVSLLENLDLANSPVRIAIVGGEALTLRHIRLLQDLNPEMRIFNEYGPTEATVGCVVTRVSSDQQQILIGKPIQNTSVYILDSMRNLIPVGVIGEMYVGGPGVARGYLNRPELTDERFIANPFSADPAARLYKTGDLARFLPDGNLEYLGRFDEQVKIRGFRVELGEIEITLDSHPGIRQSVVVGKEDQAGDKRLVAYLVPEPDYAGGEPEETLALEQVSQWTETFDESYQDGADAIEATFNITGWNSSYTGQPIDSREMRVWVETTVDRIRSLRPQRILEIGCGTGLLLFRLAPACERYCGVDISQTALRFLQKHLARPDLNLHHVTLKRKAAHELDTELDSGGFTTVLLNSVAQYFPGLDYLKRVLENAVKSVGAGGAVFIGDLRSFPLMEAFHTAVQMHQSPDTMSCSQLRQRIRSKLRQEGELLIDPAFFLALQQTNPAINRVEIQLKRGRAQNELTLFRYDVILHVDSSPILSTECEWLEWKKRGLTITQLRALLQETGPEILGLTNVPNARIRAACAAVRILSSDNEPSAVGDLRAALEASETTAVEPDDLWKIEQDLPYKVEIRSSSVGTDGCFDVLFRRTHARGATEHSARVRFPGETDVIRPWSAYANSPLQQRATSKLILQVRGWLDGKLPEYMCPSTYLLLDSLPLTANGKVNRRALPAPDELRPEGEREYVAPSSPSEELVGGIIAEVLGIDRVGTLDDFFDLGGHSLSAVQVISRIRRAFQIELSVQALFESPTVAGLVSVIEKTQHGSGDDLAPPPIVHAPRNQPIPLSIAQQRLWILDQLEPNNPLYNVPRAIRLAGNLDVDALRTALNSVVRRHEVLRTRYRVEGDEPNQVIAAEVQVALPLVDLGSLAPADRENEAQRIIQEECFKPFDLAEDHILRSLLLKLSAQEHILFLNLHHIATDGWSNGVLIRDLVAFYGAALEGGPLSVPELTIQYADYAVWQRNWLRGAILEKQLDYWRGRLKDAPRLLELPTDRPRPAVQTFRGASYVSTLPSSLMDDVRILSRQHEATVFMTLLAAFQCMILYYSKQSDIVLGTDVAGRNDVRTEALIGFFVNLLVLRTDLSGNPSVAELLGRVRQSALEAYAHQDTPFDKLVEELRPERSLGHNPLVQILFVQNTRTHTQVQMPHLQMSNLPLDLPSKFDLMVLVAESTPPTSVKWVYSQDLFDATTIERMAFLYQTAVEKVTSEGDVTLSEIMGALAEAEQTHRTTENRQFQEKSLQRLKQIKQRAAARI
jgi:amino acid adenylation domain-containing protein/FkbH-like protein